MWTQNNYYTVYIVDTKVTDAVKNAQKSSKKGYFWAKFSEDRNYTF